MEKGNTVQRVHEWLARLIEIDSRSLAVFRISMAVILIWDLFDRARDISMFYTDQGVLPASAVTEYFLPKGAFSLHLLSGELWFQLLLFSAQMILAWMLFFGWRTRIATVGSWILIVSLHNRNPMLINGGDVLLRMLLFWSMFLPLETNWSIDKGRGKQRYFATIGTAAILIQVAMMYFFSAALKSGSEWADGSAVYFVLNIDQYTRPFGHYLLSYPALLTPLTKSVRLLEWISPALLFFPANAVRVIGIILLALMQLSFALTLSIDKFPWISLAALILFIPGTAWPIFSRPNNRGTILPEQSTKTSTMMTTFAAIALIYILAWNIQTLGINTIPEATNPISYAFHVDQEWNMFAPEPLKEDGWYVMPGDLLSGKTVDVFREGANVNYEKPSSILAMYQTESEHKYLLHLWFLRNKDYRPYYARYFCNNWNEKHQDRLLRFNITFMRETTLPNFQKPQIEKVAVFEQHC